MSAEGLAAVAGLLADPTRARICVALLDGRAWTGRELARHAGVGASTISSHLTQLVHGGLLAEERQGRHRYVRLAGPETATLVESLASHQALVEQPRTLRAVRAGEALRRGRTCYDHLAGELGVELLARLEALGLVADGLTDDGRAWFRDRGIPLAGRRPVYRTCLDWTERRPHLAGAAGAALCAYSLAQRWVEPIGTGRAVRPTPDWPF